MDIGVYSISKISDQQIKNLIDQRQSFVLTEVKYMNEAVKKLEKTIEDMGLSCRVYTKGRLASVAAASVPIAPTVIGGWIAGIGIAAHNLATFNPDYEIAKNPITDTLTVAYKK